VERDDGTGTNTKATMLGQLVKKNRKKLTNSPRTRYNIKRETAQKQEKGNERDTVNNVGARASLRPKVGWGRKEKKVEKKKDYKP